MSHTRKTIRASGTCFASFASPPPLPPLHRFLWKTTPLKSAAARLGEQELKREAVHRLRLRDLGNYQFFFTVLEIYRCSEIWNLPQRLD
jgi:hypothetical protein